jgi:anti-sigma factor RsiW
MTQSDDASRRLLLHAALDEELDAKSALEVERMVAEDAGLAEDQARLVALRRALAAQAPREPAPDALRTRVLTLCETRPRSLIFTGDWRGYGAAIAATAMMTLGLQHLVSTFSAPNVELQSIVFAHMRSQISGQPVDMPSSDRHSVKPWIASKLPVDAIVVDLAAEGFPLVGGRIDIIDGVPAPTLVYKRREHLVSVTQLRRAAQEFSPAPQRSTFESYPLLSWSDAGRGFVAVSDLAPSELSTFVAAFRAAAAKEAGRNSE